MFKHCCIIPPSTLHFQLYNDIKTRYYRELSTYNFHKYSIFYSLNQLDEIKKEQIIEFEKEIMTAYLEDKMISPHAIHFIMNKNYNKCYKLFMEEKRLKADKKINPMSNIFLNPKTKCYFEQLFFDYLTLIERLQVDKIIIMDPFILYWMAQLSNNNPDFKSKINGLNYKTVIHLYPDNISFESSHDILNIQMIKESILFLSDNKDNRFHCIIFKCSKSLFDHYCLTRQEFKENKMVIEFIDPNKSFWNNKQPYDKFKKIKKITDDFYLEYKQETESRTIDFNIYVNYHLSKFNNHQFFNKSMALIYKIENDIIAELFHVLDNKNKKLHYNYLHYHTITLNIYYYVVSDKVLPSNLNVCDKLEKLFSAFKKYIILNLEKDVNYIIKHILNNDLFRIKWNLQFVLNPQDYNLLYFHNKDNNIMVYSENDINGNNTFNHSYLNKIMDEKFLKFIKNKIDKE